MILINSSSATFLAGSLFLVSFFPAFHPLAAAFVIRKKRNQTQTHAQGHTGAHTNRSDNVIHLLRLKSIQWLPIIYKVEVSNWHLKPSPGGPSLHFQPHLSVLHTVRIYSSISQNMLPEHQR